MQTNQTPAPTQGGKLGIGTVKAGFWQKEFGQFSVLFRRTTETGLHREIEFTGFCTKEEADCLAEAGTITNETGLTPRQLAEQRKELREVLKGICGLIRFADSDGRALAGDNMKEYVEVWESRACAILAKCQQTP